MNELNEHSRSVVEAARKLSGDARVEFLRRACGQDDELRRQVESSIRDLEGQSSAPTDQTRTAPLSTEAANDLLFEQEPGGRIGDYILKKIIATGGMGTIWLAEQTEPIRREVAIKVIRTGFNSDQAVARFGLEIQAVASMEHAHIAKVFEAGTTDKGRPFFSMELVRGTPITRYCQEKGLGLTARLKLFVQVCQAIQHAHQKGVIHRDIKPSNILVCDGDGGEPVPKIIDFGIARSVAVKSHGTEFFSRSAQRIIGTPAYMSPEQAGANERAHDSRSDVYSLGVLLYELLTGMTPFDSTRLHGLGTEETRRIIQEELPVAPSQKLLAADAQKLRAISGSLGIRPRGLLHLLRQDLDYVILKCLCKKPRHRYETVNGIAMDVVRFMNHEAVLAHPPNAVYRFQKLVRKHWLPFAAITTIFVTLLLGFWISSNMYVAKRDALDALRIALARQTELYELAQKNAEEAHSEALQSRHKQYAADMVATQVAISEGNLNHARSLLRDYADKAGQEDLRGFEWYYYSAVCHGDRFRTLKGHTDFINAVSWSPDGTRVASGCEDGTVRLWDTKTWQCCVILTNRLAKCTSVGFSPDGLTLACSAEGGKVYLWDLNTTSVVTTISAPLPRVSFCPTQPLIAIGTGGMNWGGNGGATSLCDLRGNLVHRFPQAGNRCAFSPDGTLLATANAGGKIKVWTVATLEELDEFNISGYALSLAFSTNGQVLYFGTGEGEIGSRGVREHEGNVLRQPDHNWVTGLALSPDGSTLAATLTSHNIELWNTLERRRTRTLFGHGGEVWAVAFSPEGSAFVSGSRDTELMVWNPNELVRDQTTIDGLVQKYLWLGHPLPSPDGRLIAISCEQRNLEIMDAFTLQSISVLTNAGMPISFSQNGNELLTCNWETTSIQKWNVQSRKLSSTIGTESHHHAWFGSAASPDGSLFAKVAQDGSIEVIETKEGKRVLDLASPSDLRTVAFSRDSSMLAVGGADQQGHGVVEVWSFVTTNMLAAFGDHKLPVAVVAFSPATNYVVTGSWDGTLKLWDLPTFKEIATLSGHKSGVLCCAFSPDGRTLASSSDDLTVKLWNMLTFREVGSLPVAEAPHLLSFSPEGSYLLSGEGHNLRFWRTAASVSE